MVQLVKCRAVTRTQTRLVGDTVERTTAPFTRLRDTASPLWYLITYRKYFELQSAAILSGQLIVLKVKLCPILKGWFCLVSLNRLVEALHVCIIAELIMC